MKMKQFELDEKRKRNQVRSTQQAIFFMLSIFLIFSSAVLFEDPSLINLSQSMGICLYVSWLFLQRDEVNNDG